MMCSRRLVWIVFEAWICVFLLEEALECICVAVCESILEGMMAVFFMFLYFRIMKY